MISSLDIKTKHEADCKTGRRRRSRAFLAALGGVPLCVAVLAGQAFAQTCPTPSQGRPVREDLEPHTKAPILPGSRFELDPGLIPVLEEEGIIIDEDDHGPSPHWYCFEPIADVDPIWRGEKLKHRFEFCNLGTVPMRINIRSG